MIRVAPVPNLLTDEGYDGPLIVEHHSQEKLLTKVSKDFGYSDLVAYFIGRDFFVLNKSDYDGYRIFVIDIDWETSHFTDDGDYVLILKAQRL
jgi:hypothetical protein